jgi:hypothetical protein
MQHLLQYQQERQSDWLRERQAEHAIRASKVRHLPLRRRYAQSIGYRLVRWGVALLQYGQALPYRDRTR